MKKLFLMLMIICPLTYSNGQSKKVKEKLKEIEGQWELDENKTITYTKVVDLPNLKKDEIYGRAINYYTYNYGSGKSVIQSKDKEAGTIIGKGIYPDVYYTKSFLTVQAWDVWHILRIDIKDEKIRIILTLTEYDIKLNGSIIVTLPINSVYPFVEKCPQKNDYGMAFYNAHKLVIKNFDEIENELKNGSTSKKIEESNW
jgi:hypothetical protein